MFNSAVSFLQYQLIRRQPTFKNMYNLCIVWPCLTQQWVFYNISSFGGNPHSRTCTTSVYDLIMFKTTVSSVQHQISMNTHSKTCTTYAYDITILNSVVRCVKHQVTPMWPTFKKIYHWPCSWPMDLCLSYPWSNSSHSPCSRSYGFSTFP
jgi:hypothetical protein